MTILDINKVYSGNPPQVYTRDGWRIKSFLKSKNAYKATPVHGYSGNYKLFTPYEYENAEVVEMNAGVASSLRVVIDLVADANSPWLK